MSTNESYEIACEKGWHEADEMGPDGTPSARQRLAWVALVLTEWREEQDDISLGGGNWAITESGKPIGAMSETVDIWIRCADTLGACGEDLWGNTLLSDMPEFVDVTSQAPYLLAIASEATRTGDHDTYARALRGCMTVCRHTTYDGAPSFEDALVLKTAYNRTRTRRHGGKLA